MPDEYMVRTSAEFLIREAKMFTEFHTALGRSLDVAIHGRMPSDPNPFPRFLLFWWWP